VIDERLGHAGLRADAGTASRVHPTPGFATLRARLAHIGRRAVTSLAFALARIPSFPNVRPGWSMSRSLLALNLLLAGLSLFFLIRITDMVVRRGPALPIRVASSANSVAQVDLAVATGSSSGVAYDLIPARNLFHPDRAQPKRSDALIGAPPAASLMLYGVVGGDDNTLAYVEDPATKKVFGYKRGDAMAGGFIERIEPDRIVVQRTGGPIEILLRAPNKPRATVGDVPPVASTPTVPPSQPTPSAADGSQGRPRGTRSRTE